MGLSRCLLIVLCVAGAGCASRKPVVSPPLATVLTPPIVDVDALIRHGCFRCLERALEAAQGERAFEVAALLTMRAKELGLPYAGYRQLAASAAPADPAFAIYLQVIDAVPVELLPGEGYLRDSTLPPTGIERNAAGPPVRPASLAERAA